MEKGQELNNIMPIRHQEVVTSKELQQTACVQLKSLTTLFLLVLQGLRDTIIFTISKHI